jgi:hypothetical protein
MTTWQEIKRRNPRYYAAMKPRRDWLGKLGVVLGCLLIGAVLGYLFGRAF